MHILPMKLLYLLYLISFILQEENYEIQNPEDIFLFLYFMKN